MANDRASYSLYVLYVRDMKAHRAWTEGPGVDGGSVYFTESDDGLKGHQSLEGGDYVFTYTWNGVTWEKQ